ncbi:MAG: tetratricopeptide repeat protein [Gemmataceae bacterium]
MFRWPASWTSMLGSNVNPRLLQLLVMLWQSHQRSSRAPSAQTEEPRPARRAIQPPPPPPAPPMRLVPTEYLLKGFYLGLVLFAALVLAAFPAGENAASPVVQGLLRLNLATLAGLVLALTVAAILRFREALRARGRMLAFFLFLLLESPTLVYLGILAGTFVGLLLLRGIALGGLDAEHQSALERLFLPVLGGSAAAGLAFGLLRQVQDRLTRLVLILVLAGGLVAAALSWLGLSEVPYLGQLTAYTLDNPAAFATQLLLAIPFFYLLTFAGHEEESEVEIAVMMSMLGLSLSILAAGNRQFASLTFLLPVVLYFIYTIRVLPGLRVLKHAFRGISYARVGQHRRALLAFRRALHLQPQNRLAREGFWDVHRSLDLDQLAGDPATLSLVDLDLCLDRAGSLLVSKPTASQLAEAERLLHMVVRLAPSRQPTVSYWRAVAHTHGGNLDAATSELERILDPEFFGQDNHHRRAVLFTTWELVLRLHPGLRQCVGLPQLEHPGRRMEAISVVERQLAQQPDDPVATELKRELYGQLDEAEYNAGTRDPALAAPYVDHHYLQQLGLSLINDDARWQRGGEFLRLAARGLPDLGPGLFVQIAQAQQRAGQLDLARHNYELAKRAGQGVGWKNLEDGQKQAYFTTVKFLADDALARGDTESAIEHFRLYSESERSGLETLRTLAHLYESKGDPLAAARATDQALQYNGKDPDLLERKDRYYYSIDPDDLGRRLEQFGTGFDTAYCLQKARLVLDRYNEPEWLDVAHHLTRLVLVVRPDSLSAKFLLARTLLRLGERDRALALLEDARGPQKPERFGSGEDEEAWMQSNQLLGDLYMEIGRADLAVPCLLDFRKSSKSGARTLFKLAQAYEALGDVPRARRTYEQVTAYEGNPLAPEAQEALSRLPR